MMLNCKKIKDFKDNIMTKYQVFYGEYSLKHWINLMLKKKIKLPPFQRKFVWKEDAVKKLIESINEKSFIPPVLIGAYKTEATDDLDDFVIDGQQRLSSLLLAYFNIFPSEQYKNKELSIAESGVVDDSDDSELIDFFEWDFSKIQEMNEILNISKDKASSILKKKGYKPLEIGLLDEDFFENNYLGFSYVMPAEQIDNNEQKIYFAKLFRSINMTGQRLSYIETRQSLYWLAPDKAASLNPKWCKRIKINGFQFDFARVLALLSQYENNGRTSDAIAKGFSRNWEQYIVDYVNSVVSGEDDPKFIAFKDEFKERIEKLGNIIPNENINYKSFIEADLELLGLVYSVVFLGKETQYIKQEQKEKQTYDANLLKYLRPRIQKSISIYRDKESCDE